MAISIIGAIVGLVASLAAAGLSIYNTNKTNAANERLAGQQNQFNLELQQLQNQYNSPIEQRKRLVQAGFNPSLAMTQSGIVDAGNSELGHPAAGATHQPWSIDTGSIVDATKNLAETSLMRAQTDKLKADTLETEARIPNYKVEAAKMKQDIEVMKQQMAESQANVKLMDIQGNKVLSDIQNDIIRLAFEQSEAESRTSLNNASKKLIDKQVKHYDEEMKKKLKLMDSEIKKNLADSKYIKKQAEYVQQLITAGNYELRATYGSTSEEIESSIKKMYETASNYYEQNLQWSQRDLSWEQLNYYMNMIGRLMNPIWKAESQAIGAAGTIGRILK